MKGIPVMSNRKVNLSDIRHTLIKRGKAPYENAELQHDIENLDPILNKTAGYNFHNRIQFDFNKLIADPNNIEITN